jgi:23S rRNA (cytosine1962-C5)-methyltransferase
VREVALEVPTPARPERLDRFLVANLQGLSRRKIKGLLDAGQVRVGDRVERRAGRTLRPGDRVHLSFRPSLLPCPALAESDVITRGVGWLAVHKPSGLPTHRTEDGGVGVPEALGRDLLVVHRLDRGTSGALLLAEDKETAAALSARFAARTIRKTYLAIVSPAPPRDSGEREDPDERGPMWLSWRVLRRSPDGSRAELEVTPKEGRTHQIRRQLAAGGTPVVGDLLYGRVLPGGAPRLGLHCAQLAWDGEQVGAPVPPGWTELLEGTLVRPTEARKAEPRPRRSKPARGPLRRLQVSRASARILRSGHPWVLPDRDTGDLSGFAPGDQALLVDQAGGAVGVALVDPAASVCARVLALDRTNPISDEDVHRRVVRALDKRRAVLADADTDCLRLVNAEADGLPGLVVDQWAGMRLATRATTAVSPFTHAAYKAIDEVLGPAPLYEKDHVQDLRRRGQGREGETLPGRWIQGQAPIEPMIGREDGLSYRVTPWASLTTGLYPDQRENRRRMVAHLPSSARVLNLFAHTGAFSVRAAASGAQRAVSVDLSPKYCEWTRENLVRNDLDPEAHPSIAAASEVWLADTRERFDFVVLDPPAFARGRRGSRGWNARRDYRSLVSACGRVLDGGEAWLLAIVNLKGTKPGWLRAQVEAGLRAAGRTVKSVVDAPPAPDVPRLRGFPERIAFRGVLVQVGPA